MPKVYSNERRAWHVKKDEKAKNALKFVWEDSYKRRLGRKYRNFYITQVHKSMLSWVIYKRRDHKHELEQWCNWRREYATLDEPDDVSIDKFRTSVTFRTVWNKNDGTATIFIKCKKLVKGDDGYRACEV